MNGGQDPVVEGLGHGGAEDVWPVFPLGTAFLPGDRVALTLFEPRYLQMLTEVLVGDGRFVSVLISEGSEVGGGDRRFGHGVVVRVNGAHDAGGRVVLRGAAVTAWTATSWLADDPYPRAVGVAQVPIATEGRERFDVASALSLLAQSVVSIRSAVIRDGDPAREPGLAEIAGGRWWDDRVSSSVLWECFWTVARALPCGSLDRYSLLVEADLPTRIRRLRAVVEHVGDLIRFHEN